MASRRKRGSVALRRGLSPDLPLTHNLSCADEGLCQFGKVRTDVCYRGISERGDALESSGTRTSARGQQQSFPLSSIRLIEGPESDRNRTPIAGYPEY
jgi:hypothetical protein